MDKLCIKCVATKKSGKGSCCARGGAWFKNCGDVGDTNFDHTWAEGIQACKAFVGTVSGESPLKNRHHHVTNVVFSLNGSVKLSRVDQLLKRFSLNNAGGVDNFGTEDSEPNLGLESAAVKMCVFIIILYLE